MTSYYNYGCALKETGEMFCWGYNANGQLGRGFSSGDEDIANRSVAKPVTVYGSDKIHDFHLSYDKQCVVLEDMQTVKCTDPNAATAPLVGARSVDVL